MLPRLRKGAYGAMLRLSPPGLGDRGGRLTANVPATAVDSNCEGSAKGTPGTKGASAAPGIPAGLISLTAISVATGPSGPARTCLATAVLCSALPAGITACMGALEEVATRSSEIDIIVWVARQELTADNLDRR